MTFKELEERINKMTFSSNSHFFPILLEIKKTISNILNEEGYSCLLVTDYRNNIYISNSNLNMSYGKEIIIKIRKKIIKKSRWDTVYEFRKIEVISDFECNDFDEYIRLTNSKADSIAENERMKYVQFLDRLKECHLSEADFIQLKNSYDNLSRQYREILNNSQNSSQREKENHHV